MVNFGRKVEIQSGSRSLTNQDFTIEFTVPFDNDLLPNESEIKIYNLTDDTIKEFEVGKKLIINAGYTGNVGMILQGVISNKVTQYSGVDKTTTIHVLDAENKDKSEVKDIAFAKGTPASKILDQMTSELGIHVAQFFLNEDFVYEEGYTATGRITDIIKKIAADCGTSAYVNKGQLYIRNLRHGNDAAIALSAESGLIGQPESFDEGEYGFEGLRLKSQLQHRITTATVIKLNSKRYQDTTLHIRKGSHRCTGSDFVTEMEGIYP
ncbi:hypothetical protein SAMN03159341_103193 [Paenibacillus sp. 1_12]|uniref:phage protein n=1 Tax=Paenibacillus sp. 1_12 TaxID=1566278 RepID=UPI0008F419F2|nr:hypothetical protein [Paenibacillus sp. 1_12]SFL09759.1 hypothetical protein SAMN03159341_103193 [Paenibacillus sp. 1_12]